MKNKIYEQSGVSLIKGYQVVNRIKSYAQKTFVPGVMGSLGNFGSVFDIKATGFKDPLLVSGADGVGTKILVAIESNHHKTIGQDLVAMCLNDVLALGAKPLYFLDYFATGKLKPDIAQAVIKGIGEALQKTQCALVGGETAEMPGMYKDNDYDLAGFVVAAVERKQLIDAKKNVKAGDVLVGITSSGLHANGFSLVRKILFQDHNFNYHDQVPYAKATIVQELLKPTKLYVNSILNLLKKIKVHGIANITGGGFYENIPRMFSRDLTFSIDFNRIHVLPIFKWLQQLSQATQEEMFSTFNMGVGMVLSLDAQDVKEAITIIQQSGEQAYVIGQVVKK